MPPPVTQRIPLEGGTVTVPSTAGATLTIEFPPGALREPLDLTVTPEALSEGEVFRAAVLPREMLFAAPVKIGLELPVELAPSSLSAMRFGGLFVGAEIDPGARTIRTERLIWGSRKGFRMLQAAPAGQHGSDLQMQHELDLIARIEDARSMLTQMETQQPDVLLAVSLNELLNDLDVSEPSPDVQRFLDEAIDRACNGARETQDALVLIDGYDQLEEKALAVMIWEGILLHAGRDACGARPAAEALEPLFDSANDFYAGPAPTATPGSDAWNELLGELDDVETLGLMANALELPGMQDTLREKVTVPLIDRLRPPAWDSCRDEGDHRPLGELLRRLPSNEDLPADIQNCGTAIEYQSRNTEGVLPNGAGALQGSRPPEASTLEASVPAKKDGTLSLAGSLRALKCPDGDFDEERLVITIDGYEVTRLEPSDGEYFSPAPTFTAEELLAAAEVPPDQATEHRLLFTREGTGCQGKYGSGSNDVASLVLNFESKEAVDIYGTYVGTAHFNNDMPWKIVVGNDGLHFVQEYMIKPDGTESNQWMLHAETWAPPDFVMVMGNYRATGKVTFSGPTATLNYRFNDLGGGGHAYNHTFVGTRQ